MATIALYAGKLNQMPGLIKDAKKSVDKLKTELSDLQKKAYNVDTDVCDLSEVISSIQACAQTQDNRIAALESFQANSEEFIREVIRIDNNIADTINQNKENFYKQYDYLKPECEKSGWEKFCDGLRAVGEWCKKHWKAVAAIAIAVAAVVIIVASGGTALGAVAPLLLTLAKGALVGTVVGGLSGGAISTLLGGNFWEGVEDGAFYGAVSGLLSAGIGFGLSGGKGVLSLGKTVLTGVASNSGTSLLGNLGDIVIAGKDISAGEVWSDLLISGTIGGGFSAFGYWVNTQFGNIPSLTRGITTGNGSWRHVWNTQLTRSLTYGSRVSLKTIMKGFGADFIETLGDTIVAPLNDFVTDIVDRLVGD